MIQVLNLCNHSDAQADDGNGAPETKPVKKDKKEKKSDKEKKDKKDKKEKKEKKHKKEKKQSKEEEDAMKRHLSPVAEEDDSDFEDAKKARLSPQTSSPSSSAPTVPSTENKTDHPEGDVEPVPSREKSKTDQNKEELSRFARASTSDLAMALERDSADTPQSTPTTPTGTDAASSVASEVDLSDSQKVTRHIHMNRYYRAIRSAGLIAHLREVTSISTLIFFKIFR